MFLFFIVLTLRLPLFCHLLFFFQNHFFKKKKIQEYDQCQTVWIQIRPDKTSGLIWVQTVCKSHQKTTLGDKELKAYQIIDISFESFRIITRNIQRLNALFVQRTFLRVVKIVLERLTLSNIVFFIENSEDFE